MKQNRLLAGITLASVVLLALHISQDIVFGFDRAGLNHLVGVGILLGSPAARYCCRIAGWGRSSCSSGESWRPECCRCTCGTACAWSSSKSSALLFIWTLYLLGVIGFLSMILAVRALVTRPSDGA